MASTTPPSGKGNLLLTLPPELRNVIYALVITTDYYELDPTISANTFPRARYRVFGIQRGIKAQDGTPSIAQTCKEIRTEALDVYYGKNTFALVGDDGRPATKNCALGNRIAANEWIQLIGNDAKYLRKVRFSLEVTNKCLVNYLISVVPNESGDEPIVTALRGFEGRLPYDFPERLARHLELVVQKLLAESGDMGKVWQAVVERALFSVDFRPNIDFDISEKGIAKASAKAPTTQRKSNTRQHRASESYKIPGRKPKVSRESEVPSKQQKVPKEPAKPSYDSDCMEVEAPAKKSKASSSRATEKAQTNDSQDVDSDVMEIGAPAKKSRTAKRRSNVMHHGEDTQELNAPIRKFKAPQRAVAAMPEMIMPLQKLKSHQQTFDVDHDAQGKDLDIVEVEGPVKKSKTTRKGKTAKTNSGAVPSIAETHVAEVDPEPATRASTRRRTPRQL